MTLSINIASLKLSWLWSITTLIEEIESNVVPVEGSKVSVAGIVVPKKAYPVVDPPAVV